MVIYGLKTVEAKTDNLENQICHLQSLTRRFFGHHWFAWQTTLLGLLSLFRL